MLRRHARRAESPRRCVADARSQTTRALRRSRGRRTEPSLRIAPSAGPRHSDNRWNDGQGKHRREYRYAAAVFPLIPIAPDPIALSFGPINIGWYGIGYVIALAVMLLVTQTEV